MVCPICNNDMVYLMVFDKESNNEQLIIGQHTCFNCSNVINDKREYEDKPDE